MNFKETTISYLGRRSYGTESTSTSSTQTGSGGSGGGGGVGGRYVPYSIDSNEDWLIENGYSTDESGQTQMGADMILPANFIAYQDVIAYSSGATTGETQGSVVEIEQLLTSGIPSAIITIDGEDTTIYTAAGSGGSIDLSNYYTSAQTNTAISNATSGKANTTELANYYTSAQTDNAIYSGIQDVTGQLNNNFWNFAYNADLTAHTANTAIHRTSADTKQQIDTSLQPYLTSAQTDERYVNVASAQTISGAKTFSAKTKVNNDLDVLEDITASGDVKSYGEVYCYGTSEVTVAPLITVTPYYNTGIKIATITVAGTSYDLYVPETTSTTTPSPL